MTITYTQTDSLKRNNVDRNQVIGRTGLVPFIDLLQSSEKDFILPSLTLINLLIGTESVITENFCIMGGVSLVLAFSGESNPMPIRTEACHLIKKFLLCGKKTIKLLIGCRGIPTLVELLRVSDFGTEPYLVALDCIYTILVTNLNIRVPKNDFCRMFTKVGLIPRLAAALQKATKSETLRLEYSDKIAEIFVALARSDLVVKSSFLEQKGAPTTVLLKCLPALPPPAYLKVLKSLAFLTTLPSSLDVLHACGTVQTLVPLMGTREGELSMESLQQIFSIIYNMCHLDTNRLAVACSIGVIPHLQWVVTKNLPLKQVRIATPPPLTSSLHYHLFMPCPAPKARDLNGPNTKVLSFCWICSVNNTRGKFNPLIAWLTG